jgi:hydrogenase maturation protein HypF
MTAGPTDMIVRRQIAVSGIVQGVGFRPYVYRLASGRRLNGRICNTSEGVTIEIQGPVEAVKDFIEHLPAQAPPLARITNFAVRKMRCNGDTDFRIVPSERGEQVHTLISPDVAICADCQRELFDANDRRYGYPLINCTNCGPRFTIVKNIPYDRPYTTMAVFPMCPACQAEYDDPRNRRFHAQPNACWECGPQVELWDNGGRRMECADPIATAADALRRGMIIAVKGLGGFHLAADATNTATVALLRERKRRVEKPFAVMVPDVDVAGELCELDACEQAVLESVQRPIVLLARKQHALAKAIAPFNRDLGIFLPYTPLHHLLLRAGNFTALVMTSGNLSEEPIAIDNHEAVGRLSSQADCFLVHNRDILLRCDDSVVRVSGGRMCPLRRSRGFVPTPVFLRNEQPPTLAVGGELKNTICLTKGKHAFLSQHIGDLENAESFKFFKEAVEHLERILEIRPQTIAYDLHPDYFSTRWAREQSGARLMGVQHHHAHIASCMAENHLEDKVIGFALDGTGYGTDGRIWGGEVLVVSYRDFERAAHFEYLPLPGSSTAIHEPWRMAVSYLTHYFGRDFLAMPIPFVRQLDPAKTDLLLQMMDRNLNSPLTSSCGRLFDAVAALIGVRQKVNYEAQAAIELEMAMDIAERGAYSLDLVPDGDGWIIQSGSLLEGVIHDLKCNVAASVISARFHRGLAESLARVAVKVRERTGLTRVCLSGGTFLNQFVSRHLQSLLEASRFEVFTHHEVPAGDGGLSLGQAMIAASMLDDDFRHSEARQTELLTHAGK